MSILMFVFKRMVLHSNKMFITCFSWYSFTFLFWHIFTMSLGHRVATLCGAPWTHLACHLSAMLFRHFAANLPEVTIKSLFGHIISLSPGYLLTLGRGLVAVTRRADLVTNLPGHPHTLDRRLGAAALVRHLLTNLASGRKGS